MTKKINKITIIHWLEGQNVRRAAVIANLVIVVIISYALAKLSWAVLDKGDKDIAAPTVSASVQKKISNRTFGGDNIAALHIFGNASTKPTQPKAKQPRLPKPDRSVAKLNFTLKGILYSDDPKFARAMIEDSSKKENTYAIGSSVKGQAIVDSIHKDKVILLRSDNSKETIRLPDKTAAANKKSSSKSSRARDRLKRSRSSRNPVTRGAGNGLSSLSGDISLSEVRQTLMKDPDSINQVIKISPISRGKKFLGFRVSPGKNRNIFKALGLKVGDIVTAVDDVKLDSPQKGFQVIEKLSTAQSMNLTVKSGSTERNVTLSF